MQRSQTAQAAQAAQTGQTGGSEEPTNLHEQAKAPASIRPRSIAGGERCGCDEGGVATPGIEGRVGAGDYAIAPREWDAAPLEALECDVLYCVGGVYGNLFAVRALPALVEGEASCDTVAVAYNGDYHWFDADEESFREVERLVQGAVVLNGNVEIELSRAESCGVGCGCSYPTSVSDAFVSRSNDIYARLRDASKGIRGLRETLSSRMAWAVARVGGVRVGITHGDERSVSGWGCSLDSLRDSERCAQLAAFFNERDIDVLSTTHTCAAAARGFSSGVVVNNGSAGLPDFKGELYGLVTRIATSPHPDALYRARFKDAFIEAVPLRYDHEAFAAWFDRVWEEGSPAAISYRKRVLEGPPSRLEDAVLEGFEILC